MATKKPEETDVERLRREMGKKLEDQERRIRALEGKVNTIISNNNSSPGKHIG
jgi:hypothetical protein